MFRPISSLRQQARASITMVQQPHDSRMVSYDMPAQVNIVAHPFPGGHETIPRMATLVSRFSVRQQPSSRVMRSCKIKLSRNLRSHHHLRTACESACMSKVSVSLGRSMQCGTGCGKLEASPISISISIHPWTWTWTWTWTWCEYSYYLMHFTDVPTSTSTSTS